MHASADFLPEEGFRWFGPADDVSLPSIRQTGAAAVFTSLHQIPYGEAWPRQAIRERRAALAAAGLRWSVVESVPVHEDLKTGRGDLQTLLANYTATLRHLAAEGIDCVVYNFMPVLDWIRTDTRFVLPDGAVSMRFEPHKFAAFELHALRRPGAEADYTPDQRAAAADWWSSLDDSARDRFIQGIIDVFPGCKFGLSLDDIRALLARYEGLDPDALARNHLRFLEAVVPVAAEVGIRLAVHPDDPPFPVLGLPRIVSTADHIARIFAAVDHPANGLCFCTGSFGARPDNDLPAMVRRFGPRIHAVHLRNTLRSPDGAFHEAAHLAGSVDMAAVASALLDEQDRRRAENRADSRLPFRPDHGHTLLDDLAKPETITPGYSCIGRLKGLAELRGLFHGLRHARTRG